MKKVMFVLLIVVLAGCANLLPAQEVITSVTDSVSSVVAEPAQQIPFMKKIMGSLGLDIWGLISLALLIISSVAAKFWMTAKTKLRQAGELLITIADSIEDKKVDANERTDLAERARILFKK